MSKRLLESLPTGGASGSRTNYLRNGIWEFKVGAKRLTWYDTDGYGAWNPKPRVANRADSEFPEEDEWWFPNFDRVIRLGHAFPKTTAKTGVFDLEECDQVRMEDLAYDRS